MGLLAVEPGKDGVLRQAFTVRLKLGCLEEWRRRHAHIWPDLIEEEQRSGVISITIFEKDPILFVYSEVLAEDSWDRLIESEVHKRWVDYMSDLSASALPDNTVDRNELPEVFHKVFIL